MALKIAVPVEGDFNSLALFEWMPERSGDWALHALSDLHGRNCEEIFGYVLSTFKILLLERSEFRLNLKGIPKSGFAL